MIIARHSKNESLTYAKVGERNVEEYETHLRGIHQMIKVRGGLKNLGMQGMVKNWIGICYGPWLEGFSFDRRE